MTIQTCKHSVLLANKEMQIKNITRCHSTPIIVTKMKSKDEGNCIAL